MRGNGFKVPTLCLMMGCGERVLSLVIASGGFRLILLIDLGWVLLNTACAQSRVPGGNSIIGPADYRPRSGAPGFGVRQDFGAHPDLGASPDFGARPN